MTEEWIHTVHRGGMWFNEIEGEAIIYSRHLDKDEAENVGRDLAERRGCGHVVHDLNGRIQRRSESGEHAS